MGSSGIYTTHYPTYQRRQDSFWTTPFVLLAVVMGCAVYGNMNKSPFFDRIWMISLNLDTVSMMPQLWMASKIGGEVDMMTSHFVALLFFSRCFVLCFWLVGLPDVLPHMSVVSCGWLIFAQILQLFISGDFMYY